MLAQRSLSPAALSTHLRDAGMLLGPGLCDVRQEQIGVGMTGRCLRLHLAYLPGSTGPASLIAKVPAETQESREAGSAMQLYVREVCFFRELAGGIGMRVPRAVHADLDRATSDFVVLLEDIAPGRMGDQIAGCSIADAQAAMAQAALLHAPFWGQPLIAAHPWLDQRQTIMPMLTAAYPMLHDAFAARYASRLGAAEFAFAAAVVPLFARMLSTPAPICCLQHGDFRLDNIMFDILGGSETMATLDWQTVSEGAGASDIAYFIGTSLDPALQRQQARDLTGRWHAGLCAAGVTGYAAEAAWLDVRRYATAGLTMAVIASATVTPTPRGDDMFLAMARRSIALAQWLDTLALWQ